MKTLTILFFVLLTVSAFAQPVRTLKLTQLETAPDSAALDGYVGVTDTNGRQRYENMVEVNVTCLTYTPPATGNLPFYHSKFVTKCSTDSSWYIDRAGRAFLLYPGLTGLGRGIFYGDSVGRPVANQSRLDLDTVTTNNSVFFSVPPAARGTLPQYSSHYPDNTAPFYSRWKFFGGNDWVTEFLVNFSALWLVSDTDDATAGNTPPRYQSYRKARTGSTVRAPVVGDNIFRWQSNINRAKVPPYDVYDDRCEVYHYNIAATSVDPTTNNVGTNLTLATRRSTDGAEYIGNVFLKGDENLNLQLPNYPNTRNDSGTVAQNFLYTDVNGYLHSLSIDSINGGGGGGSVTSVALALPSSVFDISGSPVTGTGTLTGTFDTQSANTFFAGPTSGGAATPAFRAIVAADIPLNFIDSTHIKSKGVSFNNLGPTAGIVVGQAPVWNATLSKFVATTVLTAATNASADLSGLLTNPTVVAIQNHSVSATAPTNGQVLVYNSGASEYQPTTISASGSAGGDLTGTYPNPTIAANKVDSTKVANGTLSLDDINQRGASSGQGIVWNGSAWRPTPVSAATNVQEFTANGTWTKPSGAKWIEVVCIAGGGGGGSGRRSSGGGTASGGGGGGGGGRSVCTYEAADLPSTVSVTVGTGGGGGTGITAANTNGNAGAAGGNSTFGTYLKAVGGGGGAPGNGSGNSNGGTAGGGLFSSGGTGGTGTQATFGAGAAGNYASAGGGSGGAGGSGASAGGAGGAEATFYGSTITGGTAGSSGGGVGGNGNSDTAAMLGSGGGGGGGNIGGNGGAGGNGGSFGAGGGGGGGTGSGTTSGAGGAGSNGIVVVVTHF